MYLRIKAHLLENHNLVGCLQVLQLVGDQDTRFVLQHATDTPETYTSGFSTDTWSRDVQFILK